MLVLIVYLLFQPLSSSAPPSIEAGLHNLADQGPFSCVLGQSSSVQYHLPAAQRAGHRVPFVAMSWARALRTRAHRHREHLNQAQPHRTSRSPPEPRRHLQKTLAMSPLLLLPMVLSIEAFSRSPSFLETKLVLQLLSARTVQLLVVPPVPSSLAALWPVMLRRLR